MLSAPVAAGISSVRFSRSYFDVNFIDGGFDVTLVHLGAALPSSVATIPRFGGRMLASKLPVNLLSIADVNTSMAAKHSTGWYAGHLNFDSQTWLPKVVEHYSRSGRSIYFGSSAGGFGALVLSAYTRNSSCVTVNPRTDLFRLPSVFPKYSEQTFRGIPASEVSQRIVTKAWEAHEFTNTPIWYVQNRQDRLYWNNHYLPFRHHMGESARVKYVLGDWGEGHVVPPESVLLRAVRSAVSEG